MSPILRLGAQRLGKTGIAFLIALALFSLCYFTGQGGLSFLFAITLLPLAGILSFRGFRLLKRKGLWSVRNRLLFVYGLIGVLPLLLVVVLIGLGAWALTTELAIYLASSALNQRLTFVQEAVEALRRVPDDHKEFAAPELLRNFKSSLPGMRLYVRNRNGLHCFPPDSAPLDVQPAWGNVHGLLVWNGDFFGWAHFIDAEEEITAVAPLSDELIENLVPNLGDITLFENPDDTLPRRKPASAGSLRPVLKKDGSVVNPDFEVASSQPASRGKTARKTRLPAPTFRFDFPVLYASTLSHNHLESPNKLFDGILLVNSRPSAVLSRFFTGTEFLRGVLFDIFIGTAILFLLVELAATFIGARLARRLTGSVKALYEGTRRVINGDFSHRIPVLAHDQLGELAGSFNQMTSNLERLLIVEKEKERLQTELEIAREVQGQLYPKQAPPICGLKLTVRCDPARMVSGDYYDYQELAGKRLAFAIGDVAGKGISAALLMATLHATLRAQLTEYQPMRENECSDIPEPDVARMVSTLNKQLFAHTSPEKYATFFFAVFDEKSKTLTYTNAGHLSPLLFRNEEVIPLDSNGIVVGAFPFAKYDESCLTVNTGDLLVCYTDGITEPENAYGEEFGEHRMIELIKKHYHREDQEIVQIVLDAVRSWTGNPELHDDMTLLLAREVQPA